MGYYVKIVKSNAYIPAAHLTTAYEIMCSLNTTHDHEKRGGSYSGGKAVSKWFSWMDADYPETCKDAAEILDQLGFSVEFLDNGDLAILHYDNKTGQEDLFLESIDNLAIGQIDWIGEDGNTFSTIFHGDTVIEGFLPPKLIGHIDEQQD